LPGSHREEVAGHCDQIRHAEAGDQHAFPETLADWRVMASFDLSSPDREPIVAPRNGIGAARCIGCKQWQLFDHVVTVFN
jgi:hypothetical protein